MILVSPLAFIMSVGQRSALIIGSGSDFGQRSRLTRRTRPQCLSFAEYPAFRPCRRQNCCLAKYKCRQALGLIVQESFGCCTLLRRAHCSWRSVQFRLYFERQCPADWAGNLRFPVVTETQGLEVPFAK